MIRALVLGALGYAGYKYYQSNVHQSRAAFAGDQSGTVRDAGPAAMRSDNPRDWHKVDEESDQSFPASDPPANY